MNDTRHRSRTAAWALGVVMFVVVYGVGAAALGQALSWIPLGNLALVLVGLAASVPLARWWAVSRTAERAERRKRVLLVGAGPVAEHLAGLAEEKGYHVLGTVEDLDPARRLDWPATVLAPRAALPELALYLRADQILVAEEPGRVWELVHQIEAHAVPAEVYVVPETYELALGRPTNERLGDVALFRIPRLGGDRVYQAIKRATDVTAAVMLLTLLAPVLLLAMAAIRLGSRGPALFWQERVGKDGRRFSIVKLRTMVTDAEKDGPQFCQGKRDPRLTPVGSFLRRTHLDEVPQLWNVLRGEMSLVGPRPERPCFVERFESELPRYAERHRILPGITGLAQINGHYHSSPREKLRFDLMYAYHPSLWMDLCILVRTALQVFH
ncbi:MAG: sugar transferase [Armatimonadota bacterium]